MAICLVQIKTQSLLVKTQTNPAVGEVGLGQADYVNVSSVAIEQVATLVERADVFTPSGAGMPAVTSGRNWQFQIVQELYPTATAGSLTGWHHAALFRAAPVTLTVDAGVDLTIKPATGLCRGVDVQPCTVELIEVGGNKYRAINCVVTSIDVAADPQGIVKITWTLYGDFVTPTDAASNSYYPSMTLPIMYRGAAINRDGTALATTCPAFAFGFGMTQDIVESACATGGNFAVGVLDTPASLSFTGAAAVKESLLPVWDMLVSGTIKDTSLTIDSGGGRGLSFDLLGGKLSTLASTEVNRYKGYDLTFEAAPTWEIVFT